MLVLSRRLGDSVLIGEDIEVTILGVHGGRVRLGIDAPPDIAVHRQEVFEAIKRARSRKASSGLVARSSSGNSTRELLQGSERVLLAPARA